MYLRAMGTVAVLLIVGAISAAMGEESGIDHKMRPAADFAVGQVVEDPRVRVLEVASDTSVKHACGAGTGGWCQLAQQSSQTSGMLLPVVIFAVVVAELGALVVVFTKHR